MSLETFSNLIYNANANSLGDRPLMKHVETPGIQRIGETVERHFL